MVNADIEWKEFYLKMSPDKNWARVKSYQFNSVPEPTRLAYMKSKIMGLVSFEGRDKYQEGHANMLIKLIKLIKIADAKGKEMDESGLVTVLAETFFVPTYALQDYITWTAIDPKTAKAVIKFNKIEVGGLFYFDEDGRFIRFETNDRYYSESGKEYKKIKWSAVVDDYIENNGIKIPCHVRAIWHTEEGDYEYFKGSIDNIRFNVK